MKSTNWRLGRVLPLAFLASTAAGCAAQTGADGQESTASTKQALGADHSYTVRLHQLNVSRTRAKYQDTITVILSAKINGNLLTPVTYKLGDHGSGDMWPLLPFTFTAGDDDDVEVLVSVVNDHNPDDAASKAVSVLNTVSDYAEKFVQSVYPAGPVWPAVNDAIHTVNGWFAGGCDGDVAADAILGKGSTFRDWTASGVYYGNVQRHDGSNSPWFCGATSLYFTQYSVTRNW